MDKDYREIGIENYGDRCELCSHSVVEVHHIDYHLHQGYEDSLRIFTKQGKDLTDLLNKARSLGFMEWDGHNLSKDSRPSNLSVLCPTCHSLIHTLDSGTNLLKALRPRKQEVTK